MRRPYSAEERQLVRCLIVELGWGRFDTLRHRLPTPRSLLSVRGLANALRDAHADVAAAYARRRETATPAQRLPWTDADDAELVDAVVRLGWGRLGAVVAALRKKRSKNAVVTRLSVMKKRSPQLRAAHAVFLSPRTKGRGGNGGGGTAVAASARRDGRGDSKEEEGGRGGGGAPLWKDAASDGANGDGGGASGLPHH